MTITSTDPRNFYNADGLTDTFIYSFEISEEDDLQVYLDGVLQVADYTVTGVGDDGGGTVVFDTEPADETRVALIRNTEADRATVFSNKAAIDLAVLDADFDRITAMIQELAADVGRSIRMVSYDAAPDASAPDLSLPVVADRASKIITFDEDGNLVVGAIDDLIDDELASTIWRQGAEVSGGAVESVFGRTGAVVAASGDYDADEVTETATRVFVTPTSKALLTTEAQSTIMGRAASAGTGAATHLTATQARTILNVEDGADVTDATNVDAAGAVMNGDTSTAAMSFVIDEDSMATNSATKVPTQQSVKAYVDAQVGTATNVIELDVTSGGTLTNNAVTTLITAATTQTVTWPAVAAEDQYVDVFNYSTAAQTQEVDATGSETFVCRPGETGVTAFLLPIGGRAIGHRDASASVWRVSYVPPVDLASMAVIADVATPVAALGTLSSPHTPDVADGALCTGTLSGDVTINIPDGDPPANTYTTLRYVLTASADATVTLHASYGIDGALGDLTWANGETKSIQWEYDGSGWNYVGVLTVDEFTVASGGDVNLPPSECVGYVTGSNVFSLADTTDLAGPTFIFIIKTASGDRTMTLQSGSDAFDGSAIITDAAPIACFFASPSDTTWYRV